MKHVTAAVIRDGKRVLICRRPMEKSCGGMWEFPGGKLEEGESLQDCLVREIHEELDLDIQVLEELGQATGFGLCLHFFLCTMQTQGKPRALEHMDMRWVDRKALSGYTFCNLDAQFLQDPAHVQAMFRPFERLFVAVPLPEDVRKALQTLQQSWKDSGVQGRFIPQSQMHITLAFIGETLARKTVMECMEQLAMKPLSLTSVGAGHFRSLYYASVQSDPARALKDLASRLQSALQAHGVTKECKPFQGHITLLRDGVIPDGLELEAPMLHWQSDQIVLFASVFTPSGVTYHPLYTRKV